VIEPDETTIIRVSRSEMGQGNFTTLPTLVAEELECDRRFVRPEGIDPSENIARGHPGAEMVTAASISVCGSQTYMRKANFHDYRALRTNETPQVETHFLFSENRYTEEWGGVGEPGTPPLEAAISNAVFAATGQRIRSLPFANH
jgi:CO/xanthine dehydrogenase Mo-binding subunit